MRAGLLAAALCLAALTALPALGGSAGQEIHRLTLAGGEVRRFDTDASFGVRQVVDVRVAVDGGSLKGFGRGHYEGFVDKGVLVEALFRARRDTILVRVANLRSRPIRVLVRFRWGPRWPSS